MSIFKLHDAVIDDFSRYVQSFFSIKDNRINSLVEQELFLNRQLWPDVLIQLNPSYLYAETIEDMVKLGKLNRLCAGVFRTKQNQSIKLFQHQKEAIEKALRKKHFIITSGTGSGKTLTYLIPIFNRIVQLQSQQVRAIIIYPMNALVNSQYEALREYAEAYKDRTGQECPVRFEKYTGQETLDKKLEIQKNPPHILLTNYVMAELMLDRPAEHNFVDRATSGLEFLVIDEVHTYRGRQGADVGLLIRRLREKCGNPGLLCIGTSATMASGKKDSKKNRQEAIAKFAEKLFGVPFEADNIVEETLDRYTDHRIQPTPEALEASISADLPQTSVDFLVNPLSVWIEETFGTEVEADGTLRRKTPISLKQGAKNLSDITGISEELCMKRLQEFLLAGFRLSANQEMPLFAFKLHQFFSQGQTIYATFELPEIRKLSVEGEYYASDGDSASLFYPLQFCRTCGQEYYAVYKNEQDKVFIPYYPSMETSPLDDLISGYLMIVPEEQAIPWNFDSLPPEWFNQDGRLKSDYRDYYPQLYWVRPNGSYSESKIPDSRPGFYQPRPFLLCLNCGEVYTKREKNDYKKLVGLSTEGRSSSTTIISSSVLKHANEGGITKSGQKVLSFTDNRQDASLQAGHFNDFVMVSLLRAGILAAIRKYKQLTFANVAQAVDEALEMTLSDRAQNKQLDPSSPQAKEAVETFVELIEYRIYEDLRRGWRVMQPNLEQCGLLAIDYNGLNELCADDKKWIAIEPMASLTTNKRNEILKVLLDHFRRKLSIYASCFNQTKQSQLIKKVNQYINERWSFDENERLKQSSRFILPQYQRINENDLSLSKSSLLGRYLRKTLKIGDNYDEIVNNILDNLTGAGLLRKFKDRETEYVQLDAACLIWKECDLQRIPFDAVYSGRIIHSQYDKEAFKKANKFFRSFYSQGILYLKNLEGLPHSAQVSYEERQEREKRFKDGELPCLFCSPTMELGIDIADLQLLHLRNVPPTPANYAQRSGRAGRRGDPALILTYCAANSGHDQYFFHHQDDIVSGIVRPPQIDFNNEDLIKAHLHAIWLGKVNLDLGDSIIGLLVTADPNYPLKDAVKTLLMLSEGRFRECVQEAKNVVESCSLDDSATSWMQDEWLENILRRSPEEFDKSFNRWRELYRAADHQWQIACEKLRHPLRDRDERKKAEAQRTEAEHQKDLLCNVGTTREESDFYPYRYLASEGFMPGYNFPRLPIRAYIPRAKGEYISRPRFLAISEFGPRNIIYHEGSKYEAGRLIVPPGGLEKRTLEAKICSVCGYFHDSFSVDVCENCGSILDGSTSEIINLLEMQNIGTWKRERISSDEEERRRFGYDISSHFRFSPEAGGEQRKREAFVLGESSDVLLKLVFSSAAELFRINHGWRNRRENGFCLDMIKGDWVSHATDTNSEPPSPSTIQIENIELFVKDYHNLLLFYLPSDLGNIDESFRATLQYCLQRGIEQIFQVEESELASERIGLNDKRAILLYEASEGGVGVLRQLVTDRDTISKVAKAALERSHFDPETLEDKKPKCIHACYECLLSYSNQKDYPYLKRHLVKDFLKRLMMSTMQPITAGRNYEEHYHWLRSLTDTRSDLERKFIDFLYSTKRQLPDDAQKALADYQTIPDFFYNPNCCVFCDGSVHDEPSLRAKDEIIRSDLKNLGYRVIVIRHDQDLAAQIAKYSEIFGKSKEDK